MTPIICHPFGNGLIIKFFLENNFVENMQKRIKTVSNSFKEIPRVQRRVMGQPLSYYVDEFSTAKEGMQKAYATGDYTKQQIVSAFGVHYSTVSRAVKNIPVGMHDFKT